MTTPVPSTPSQRLAVVARTIARTPGGEIGAALIAMTAGIRFHQYDPERAAASLAGIATGLSPEQLRLIDLYCEFIANGTSGDEGTDAVLLSP